MIYEIRPSVFNPIFDVVGCFVENNKEILLLHRQDYKPQGNTWGIPSGKVDSGENLIQALSRELIQETGIYIDKNKINSFKSVFVKYSNYDFIYHMYHLELTKRNKIRINHEEHKNYIWISPEKSLRMNLIQDLESCIKLLYYL